MFKRVEKRRRKKEEEEELGLDDDAKEVFGIHDTDSDESESDSESEQDDEGTDDGRERGLNERDEGGGSSDSDGNEDKPSMTVREALQDPLHVVSLDGDVKSCIVCPGKLLKTEKMIKLHSSSHVRSCT
jgi:hypothetical protein